ncbi:MAG: FtsQ-type POTRA domain-containing protein [Peptococcaceae bacterium]|jgi:cell division protein FtsQ|nr:FtsQ-type POTRA domain-containing protein [Peptococcaceae bacterium]
MEETEERKKKNSGCLYLAVLVVLIILGSALFILRSGMFAVQTILVQGNRQVNQSEILRLADYIKGKNLFLTDTKELRRKVLLHPLLNSADFQKRIPDTITITVTERASVALVLVPKGVIEVDRQGVFLRRLEGWPTDDYPVINGVNVPDTAGPGQILSDAALQEALRVLAEGPPALIPFIGEIYTNQIQQLTIFLTTGVEVRLGQAKASKEKLEALLELLNDESYQSFEPGVRYIDFTASKPVIGWD